MGSNINVQSNDLEKENLSEIVQMNEFQKDGYIPKDKRKKIILLSDDLRMPSGVGVMSREIVLSTAHRFNWFQVGAAIKHPEEGKLFDISQKVSKETGVPDPSVKILASSGYGNEILIRQLLDHEKPDAILHYTDPRFWIWLYQMENEIRQEIPIFFYHVWDNIPYPMYNKPYYESCDWIGCISKQTENIVKNVHSSIEDWQVDYVPHGINNKKYYPITDTESDDYKRMQEMKKMIFGNNQPEFVLFYNNRNIQRKKTSNIIMAFNSFIQSLPKEKRDKCVLLLHTQPIDNNGTDLPTVANALAPDARILFSAGKVESKDLNCLYNISDATINMANAEGFGLGTAESIMAGTPIIATVTGGLQDQMKFTDENNNPINFNKDFPTNSEGKYKDNYGEWAFPLFPRTRALTGSPPTPYINDDFSDYRDAKEQISKLYNMTREERKERGRKGREWMLTQESGMSVQEMGRRFIDGMETAFKNWNPQKRFDVYKI